MAKKDNMKYEFVGLPIYDIIGKPLIAIARAQNMMAKEQLRTLLDSCFRYRDGVYEPIMLKMTVTRSFLEPAKKPDKSPEMRLVTTHFYLPMVTIFPINALGVESVDIDFNIEVTAQYMDDITDGGEEEEFTRKASRMECLAKIAKTPSITEQDRENSRDESTSLRINVAAGTLPLTKGLLEIINIYTNAIQPTEIAPTGKPFAR